MSETEKQIILGNLLQELNRGTLVFIVLLNASQPGYGYSLINQLQEAGVSIDQNTLYPLLRRLEKQGLLSSVWDTTEARPRKYYKISDAGREVLDELIKEWQKTNLVIEKMISNR
jgi:PadR family transcriptional regulator, regulatory protein PadR